MIDSITAKVIADSVSEEGVRLTTIQARYPRMIHSELMTHRVFSRNGRSSRAVPVATLIKEEPYVPHFMQNQPGMVAMEEMPDEFREEAEYVWKRLVKQTKDAVSRLNELKVHKQWANRPLEWFGYIDVLISSTDWSNFFALRDEVGAQPEIDAFAKAVKVAMDASKPTQLLPGQWHMPYINYTQDVSDIVDYLRNVKSIEPRDDRVEEVLKQVSVARCARLTFKPFDGDGSIAKEVERYERLMVSRPVHASPAEHIATPDIIIDKGFPTQQWYKHEEHGNFYGWRQFRKMIPYNTVYDR